MPLCVRVKDEALSSKTLFHQKFELKHIMPAQNLDGIETIQRINICPILKLLELLCNILCAIKNFLILLVWILVQ